MNELNLTSKLLMPTVGTKKSLLDECHFINCYLYDKNNEEDDGTVENEYLYLTFENKVNDQLADNILTLRLRNSPNYIKEYIVNNQLTVVMKMNFPECKKLFIDGKYSEFPEKYINQNFSKFIEKFDENGYKYQTVSVNYQIFTKDEALKKYWEKRIGIPLPENAEVWSKPDIKQEVNGTLDR